MKSGSHRWTTPAPNYCSGSSPPPTNAAHWPSPPTGPSTNGDGSYPNTPPPSASWTGSCTTPQSSSPPASPTACATPETHQEAAPPHPEPASGRGLSPGQNRGPQTGH